MLEEAEGPDVFAPGSEHSTGMVRDEDYPSPPEDHDLAPSASPSRRQGGSGLEGGAEGKGEGGREAAEPLGPCTAASHALNHK